MTTHATKIIQILVIITVVIILCVYNIPFPVHKTYSALEINMADASHCEARTISIDGYYHINLFSDDHFSGSFEISGYEELYTDHQLLDAAVSESGASLIYEQISDSGESPPDHFLLGKLYSDFMLSKIAIGYVIDENGSNGSTDTCNVIVTNTDSREEAYNSAAKQFWPDEYS